MARSLLFFACMLGLFIASVSFAGPPHHEPKFEWLAEEIQVSEEQMDSFLMIMRQQHENRKRIYREGREAAKEQMEQLDQEMLDRLEYLLTAEQMNAFKARLHQRKQERKMHRLLNAQSLP